MTNSKSEEKWVVKDHYQFGKNLKKVMTVLGINQKELANMSGLTEAAISQLLHEVRDPSLHTLVKILKAIPVKFERLVNYK